MREREDLRAATGWVSEQEEIRALPLIVLGESRGASVALLVVAPITRRIGEKLLGVPLEAIAPKDVIAAIAPRPILLIQGQEDRLVTPDNARRLQACSPDNITLWEVQDARPVRSLYVAPDKCARRVTDFLAGVPAFTPSL